jgi:Putative prokaryotic signal transducing protein
VDFNEPHCIFTTSDPIKADLIKNMLNAEGIKCALEGHDQSFGPGFMPIEIKVLVESSHEDQARKLIEAHEHHTRG